MLLTRLQALAIVALVLSLLGIATSEASRADTASRARNYTSSSPCEHIGRLVVAVKRTAKRTDLDFNLRDAVPFLEYGFEVEVMAVGGGIQYVGSGPTDLNGDLDLSGTTVESPGKVHYVVFAGNSLDSCSSRGVVRPPKRR